MRGLINQIKCLFKHRFNTIWSQVCTIPGLDGTIYIKECSRCDSKREAYYLDLLNTKTKLNVEWILHHLQIEKEKKEEKDVKS